MRAYRTLWIGICSVVAVGAVLGVVTFSFAGVIGLGVCSGLIGGAVYSAVHSRAADQEPAPGRATRVGLATAALSVGGAGLIALLGSSGLLLFVLLLVASPRCISGLRRRMAAVDVPGGRTPAGDPASPDQPPRKRWRLPPAEPSVRPQPTAPPMPDCASLDNDELCRTWRHSFVVLDKAEPGERLPIVQLRQACLDELQRRDPSGFARWIGAGARAASDPGRYLFRRDAPGQRGGTDSAADHLRPAEGN
jgi:hypothetical protein